MGKHCSPRLNEQLLDFVLNYIDYHECAEQDNREQHRNTRQLGNLVKRHVKTSICKGDVAPKIIPVRAKRKLMFKDEDPFYISAMLTKLIYAFHRQRVDDSLRWLLRSSPPDNLRLRWFAVDKAVPTSIVPRRENYVSNLSKEFKNMLNDKDFCHSMYNKEQLNHVLNFMWHPLKTAENVAQYAIAKHASIHYILSTHAILPSSECFTPNDIQRIMHLPIQWIGGLPRLEDTRCITKFIARFSDLFSRDSLKFGSDVEDPLDKHARMCGQRVFMDIIRYASDGIIPKKPIRKWHRGTSKLNESQFSQDSDYVELPPLDWEDQLSRKNVKVTILPEVENPSSKHVPPTRAIRRQCKQDHLSSINVNVTELDRAIRTVCDSKEFEPLGKTTRKQRHSKVTAIERANRSLVRLRLPKLHDKTAENIKDRIMKEEDQYYGLVSHLPHHQNGIRNLANTNRKLLSQLQQQIDLACLRQVKGKPGNATEVRVHKNLCKNFWNPNRQAMECAQAKAVSSITSAYPGTNTSNISPHDCILPPLKIEKWDVPKFKLLRFDELNNTVQLPHVS